MPGVGPPPPRGSTRQRSRDCRQFRRPRPPGDGDASAAPTTPPWPSAAETAAGRVRSLIVCGRLDRAGVALRDKVEFVDRADFFALAFPVHAAVELENINQ